MNKTANYYLAILFLFQVFLSLSLASLDIGCGLGCELCSSNLVCSSCKQGFEFDESKSFCRYTKCDSNFLASQQSSSLNQDSYECVAICNQNEIADYSQQTCNQVYECSLEYQTPQQLNDGVKVIQIGLYMQQFIALIYNSKYNIFNLSNGQYVISYEFQQNQQIILANQNMFKIDLENETVQILDILNGSQITVFQPQIGQNLKDFQFLVIDQNYALITTTDLSQKTQQINLFTYSDLQKTSLQNFPFQGKNILVVEPQYILSQNQTQDDLINLHQFKVNSSTNLYQLSQIFVSSIKCSFLNNLKETSNFFKVGENKFIFTIEQNKNNIYSLDSSGCFIALKVNLFLNIKYVEQLSALFIMFEKRVEIYQLPNFNLLKQLDFQNSLLDFEIVNLDYYFLYVLDVSPKVLIYKITSANIEIQLKEYQQILIKISDPLRIQLANQKNNNPLALVYNYDCQVIDPKTSSSLYSLKNFQANYPSHQQDIIQIMQTSDEKFLITASSNGQIIAWQLKSRYRGEISISFDKFQDSCQSASVFYDRFIFLNCLTQVRIYDLNNPYYQNISQKINSQSSTLLTTNTLFAILNKDSCLIKYDNQLNVVLNKCSSNYQSLNNIQLLQLDDQLIIVSGTLIQLLDVSNQSSQPFKVIYFYNHSTNILQLKFRFYSNQIIKCVFIDEKQQLFVLATDLSVDYQVQVKQFYSIIDFNYPSNVDEEEYMVLGYIFDPAEPKKCQFYLFSKKNNQSSFIFKLPYITQIVSIIQRENQNGNKQYLITPLIPLSFISLVYPIIYDIIQESVNFGQYPDLYFEYCKKNINLSNKYAISNYIGTQNGQIVQSTLFKNVTKQVHVSPQGQPINSFFSSLRLERYFILSYNIFVYNIHSDQQEEILTFNDQVNFCNSYEINYQIQMVIFLKPFEVVVRDYLNTKLYHQTFNNKIYGAFICNYNKKIFIFGQGLQIYSLELKEIQVIQSELIISSCIFGNQLYVCKQDPSNILVIDSQLNLLVNFEVVNLPSAFKIYYDQQFQRILAFDQQIIIYNIQGINQGLINQAQTVISEIHQFGDKLLGYFNSGFLICDYQSMKFLTNQYTADTDQVIKVIYIEENDVIVYTQTSTRYAQMYFYSLKTLTNVGTFSSANFNSKNQLIDMYLDRELQQIVFIDTESNVANVILANLSEDNGSNLKLFPETNPVSMNLNFEINTILVSDQKTMFRINYSQMIQSYIQIFNTITNSFAQILLNDKNYFLIIDSSQIVYQYNNFQMIQVLNFQEKVLDIQVVQNNNQQVVVLAFQKQIITYSLYHDSTIVQLIQKDIIRDYFYKQCLGDSLFFTYDNKLIDYDFLSNKQLFSFQFNYINNVISDFQYIPSQKLLIIGFFSGQVFVYYQQSLQIKELTKNQQFSDQLVRVIYTDAYIQAFYRDGNILNLYEKSDTLTIKILQSSYTQNQQLYELSNAVYDSLYHRLYVNFQDQQKLYVLGATDLKILKFLSHGCDNYNRVYIGENLLLLYNTFQINIYTRDTLKFNYYIRRNSRIATIDTVNLVQDSCLIICYTDKIEIVNLQKSSYQIIDSYTGSFIKLLNSKIEVNKNNEAILKVIFFSTQQVFENYYSINLKQSGSKKCSYSLISQNHLEAELQFQQVYQSDLQLQYSFYYQIQDSLDVFHQIYGQSVQFIINPLNKNNDSTNSCSNELNLHNGSFLNLQNNVMINCFSFKFTKKGAYSLSPSTNKVILQNISIINQQITQINLNLSDQNTVVMHNFLIDGINLSLREKQVQLDSNQYLILIQNCTTLSIYGLQIKNIDIQMKYPLFLIKNVQQVFIKNSTIEQSTFSQIFQFESCDSIQIDTMTIENNKGYLSLDSSIGVGYLLEIYGSRLININNLNSQNNLNVNLISSSNIQTKDDQIIYLSKDIFILSQSQFNNNKFSEQFLQIQGEDSTMILLQNSQILVESILFSSNEENIQISKSQNATVKDCLFINNTCFNGGALQAYKISEQLNITNSQFTNNTARGSGGSIFLRSVYKVFIDPSTIINQNQAQIGGGIRFIFDEKVSKEYIISNYQIFAQMFENKGQIYGNNLGSYPYKARLTFKTESSIIETNIIDPQSDDNSFDNYQINIDRFQSGGYLNVTLQFLDYENSVVKIQKEDFFNQKYIQSIINDIKQLNFVLLPISISYNSIYLSDQSLVNINQYNKKISSFIKDNLQISGIPSTKSKIVLNYQPSLLYDPISIQIQISFRECFKGEIFKNINKNIIQCYQCPNGFYSLVDVSSKSQDLLQLSQQNSTEIDSIICKKCPDSAVSCQGKSIKLKNGYWRVSEQTENIFQCVNNESSCVPEDEQSKQGCSNGYIGPLCDFCDSEGVLWGHRYTSSSQKYYCSQCSEFHVQIIYISIFALITLIYVAFQVLSFMQSYIHYQQSYYIRICNLLPISMSTQKEQSGFFMKILINYLQITAILLTVKPKVFPRIIMTGPSILGNTIGNITIDMNCVYPQSYIRKYGTGRLRQITQSIIPPTVLIILLSFFSILEKLKIYNIGKYHKYTLVSFTFMFFQPDSLNLYSKSLTCRQIGSLNVYANDTLFDCNDPGYSSFIKFFTIPILVFWIVFPLVPLFFLAKKRDKLNWCSVKLKLGYYYTEFKQKFFYWEFVRIYVKMLIVLIYTFLQNNKITTVIMISFVITVYLNLVIHLNPFYRINLKNMEIFSFMIILLQIGLQELGNQMESPIFEVSQVLTNYIFIFYTIYFIVYQKLMSQYSYTGRIFRYLISKVYGKQKTEQLFIKNTLSISCLLRWKKIRYNIQYLIKEKQVSLHLKSRNSTFDKQRSDHQLIKNQIQLQNSDQFLPYFTSSPLKQYRKSIYSPKCEVIETKQLDAFQIFQLNQKQNSIENSLFPQKDELLEQSQQQQQQNQKQENVENSCSQDLENEMQYQEDIFAKSQVICSNFKDGIYKKQMKKETNQYQQ